MADMLVLEANEETRGGSSPPLGIKIYTVSSVTGIAHQTVTLIVGVQLSAGGLLICNLQQ